jgi:hypothetical protein
MIAGAFESSAPVIVEPKPILAVRLNIGHEALPSSRSVASQRTQETLPSRSSTPLSSPPPPNEDSWEEARTKMSPSSSVTKEERAAEMARKKDERKQVCIARFSFAMFTEIVKPAHCSTEGAEEKYCEGVRPFLFTSFCMLYVPCCCYTLSKDAMELLSHIVQNELTQFEVASIGHLQGKLLTPVDIIHHRKIFS